MPAKRRPPNWQSNSDVGTLRALSASTQLVHPKPWRLEMPFVTFTVRRNEFGESGHKEGSRFLELFVAYLGKRLDDALDVLPRHIVRMLLSDSLNELRLRHQLGHVSLPISESSCD
jgi:hypothetical protein